MRLKKTFLIISLVLAVLVLVGTILVILSSLVVNETFSRDYALFRSIKIGMSEQHVVNLLGKPVKIYSRGTAPKDYYVKGYSYKEREISNKVFIYIASEPIAYIYFDDQNNVEDVFVGGS